MDRIIEMEIDLYQAGRKNDDHHTEILKEEYERLKEKQNEISEQCEQKNKEYYRDLDELHELYRKCEEIKQGKRTFTTGLSSLYTNTPAIFPILQAPLRCLGNK